MLQYILLNIRERRADMIVDSWLEKSFESNRIAATLMKLRTSHVQKDSSFQSDRWMDDLNDTYSGPEDEIKDDYSWMDDDLDEAA
jgi:hypothetical protein